MHQVERASLWIIVGAIVVFLFFRQTSGFTNRQTNIMSLAEFAGVPQPLKDAYVQNMTPIVNAFSQKLTSEWNSMSPDDKQNFLIMLSTNSNQIVQKINQAPNTRSAVSVVSPASPAPAPMVASQSPSPAPMVAYQSPSPAPMVAYQSPYPAPMVAYQSPSPAPMVAYRRSD